METLIVIIIAIGCGIFLGYLLGKNINSKNSRELDVLRAETAAKLAFLQEQLNEKAEQIARSGDEVAKKNSQLIDINQSNAELNAELKSSERMLDERFLELKLLKEEIAKKDDKYSKLQQELSMLEVTKQTLENKLETQTTEIQNLNKKFTTEFENIANKILESKTEKFTELNKINIKTILEPLAANIDTFKKQINDVYVAEAKERFSLGEKVKELVVLNHKISEEANNLTKALKGEAKTQGMWGEMILESILENSGLRKNEQYFLEHELKDQDDKHILSDIEGKKMRPDVVIKYPDNRNVIIDAKVSLNAFARMVAATDAKTQNAECSAHVAAIKNHINLLSGKGYDDYDKALDFVLMFIPSEPAYIAALQNDSDLWHYAYNKRILLISPTNLITSLKLIVDLWKREAQNQNALEIASRGAKLYDKFVGFITNLQEVGDSIEKAQIKYHESYKQLSTGNDNLVLQATKLKNLGLKTKKEMPKEVLKEANMLEDSI